MKTELLRRLRNADSYVSGQELCDQFGVSRTAVWKWINQLKAEGYQIDAVSNKGYQITSYPDNITASEIESLLTEQDIIKHVVFFDETDSTNNEAKRDAEKGAKDGTLYLTEAQNAGRGRRGRQWLSPAGSGVWMSLLLRPELDPRFASMLTIVTAVAVVEAIQQDIDVDCKIKWPNDIVVNKHKVCGILTEMSAEMEQINYVVIGIGINVNTEDFDESIKDMASSIYKETGVHVKRSELISRFSKSFSKYYQKFLQTKDLSGLLEVYNNMLINKNKQVKIIDRDTTFTAVAQGMNELGELIIQKEDGSIENVVAGEVSVRGLYGYV